MSAAILRAANPDALLDWGRIFDGNMIDDVSGLPWEQTGTITQGVLLGDPSAVMAGGAMTRLRTVPAGTDWSVVLYARKDAILNWGRALESTSPTTSGDSDLLGIAIYQTQANVYAFYDAPGLPFDTDLRMEAPIKTLVCYTLVYRAGQFETWYNGRLLYDRIYPALPSATRDWYIGCGYRGERWNGEVGGWAYWRRALSASEIADLSRVMFPDVSAIPTGQVSDFYPSMIFDRCLIVSPGMARVDGLAGPGHIAATVKILNRPVSRIVYCEDQETGVRMGKTWSDPITGAYRFDGLALDRLWFIHSHDHEREYNAATADYRYAEVDQ